MNKHSGHLLFSGTLALVVMGLFGWGSSPAIGQLTPEQLLSTSVEKYDSQYADVAKAIQAFQRGNVIEARDLLVSERKRHPTLAPPDTLMAMLYFSINQREEADEALENAAANDPQDPEAFLLAGDLALSERRLLMADLAYQRSEALLKPAVDDDWRSRSLKKRLHAGLSALAESRKQYDAAMSQLQAWQKLDPKNPMVQGSLGRISFHRGDYAAARSAFAELVKNEPSAPPVEVAMGRLFTDAGNMVEARKCMTTVLESHGDDHRTQLTVADWAINNGLPEMARKCVNTVLRRDAASIGANVLAGRMARFEKDHTLAQSILTNAILRSPNEFAISNELARVLALSTEEAQRKSGLEYAVRNFRMFRSRASEAGREATMTYAWLLLKNDQAQEAEKVLHSLPDSSPVSSENAYYAAMIYRARGRNQLAMDTLRAAIGSGAAFPDRIEAQRLLKGMDVVHKTN